MQTLIRCAWCPQGALAGSAQAVQAELGEGAPLPKFLVFAHHRWKWGCGGVGRGLHIR